MKHGAWMQILRIRQWETFEKRDAAFRSDGNGLRWVAVPTKMDGEGYRTLVAAHANGAAHLGAWLAILEIAAKCKPRGVLMRDNGTAHDAKSLSIKSDIPSEVFAEAIPRLLSIGWLEFQQSQNQPDCTDFSTSPSSPTLPHCRTVDAPLSDSTSPTVGQWDAHCRTVDAPLSDHNTIQDKTIQDSITSASADEYPQAFLSLWQSFPPKARDRSSKKKALAVWRRVSAGKRADLDKALAMWLNSDEWKQDGGKFVPGAHRWIGEGKWESPPAAVDEEEYQDPDLPEELYGEDE